MMPLLLALVFISPALSSQAIQVNINTKHYSHESADEFLSISLSCSIFNQPKKRLNFADAGVMAMARGLSPAILRLGGTACNYMLFNDTNYQHPKHTFKLNSSEWDSLVQFTRLANLSLLFGVNVMYRDEFNQWDPSNLKNFLDYNQRMGYTNLLFELGNEPTSIPTLFNVTISAAQLATDYSLLKEVLRSYPLYKQSLIVGPDIVNPHLDNATVPDPVTYLHDYFKTAHRCIDAVTWHQYYCNGHTAKLADFVDPQLMDDFPKQVQIIADSIHKVIGNNRTFPVWMGETSSAYGGGAPNISNTYVAGFLWMDKLGVSARSGYDVVIRQTFYGGSYSLIDNKLLPYPDYWLSLLYKQLVGTRTLSITINSTLTSLRVYASCTNTKYGAEAGDITVYAMNLDKTSSAIISPNISFSSVLSYNMEPTDGTLTSPLVNINGNTARLIKNKLPKILPRVASYISLKPLTFGLFVLTGANASACL